MRRTQGKPLSPARLSGLVDGALLAAIWDELDLPRQLRIEWQSLVDHARNGPTGTPIDIAVDETLKNRRADHTEAIAARPAAREAEARSRKA